MQYKGNIRLVQSVPTDTPIQIVFSRILLIIFIQFRFVILGKCWAPIRSNPVEMVCRGKIPLNKARIAPTEPCLFEITHVGVEKIHVKAENVAECAAWLSALQLAKAKWL